MQHIHIDKAIGGTNDGRVTPFMPDRPILQLIKRRAARPVGAPSFTLVSMADRLEIECYRLEKFMADDCLITFWVELSLSPAAALCNLLLRYVPRKDATTISPPV